jgi:diguanylate cyclase
LQSVAPDPQTLPKRQPFSDDVTNFEQRFWAASDLFMELSNYVYFGGADGRFVGVNRVNKDFVELYLYVSARTACRAKASVCSAGTGRSFQGLAL